MPWIYFEDGAAEGVTLHAQRAPLFLRAVADRERKWDVLDQLDDEPKREEELYVYERVSVEHRCYRGEDRNKSGWYNIYQEVAIDSTEKATLRYNERWRQWARSTAAQ